MVHFVDWLPTLAAAANIELPNDRPIDGQNILRALQGEKCELASQRFWQWNRYEPVVSCNAAMRDGPWKLVRPAISAAMQPCRVDQAVDFSRKHHPEWFASTYGVTLPERQLPAPPAPELYNIAEDPLEKTNLASAQTSRAGRMLQTLETWFEQVEAERQSIEEDQIQMQEFPLPWPSSRRAKC